MKLRIVSIPNLMLASVAAFALGCTPGGSGNGGDDSDGEPPVTGQQDAGMGDGGAGGGEGGAGGAGGEGGGEVVGGTGGEGPGGEGGEGGEGGSEPMGGAGGGDPSEGSGTCQGTTFDPEQDIAFIEDYGVYYQAVDTDDPATAMLIEFHDDRGGPVGPGTYDLAGQNLDTCQVCVLACTVVNNACQSIYMAQEGVLELTERGADMSEPFSGQLHRVRYQQVNINQNTRQAEPIEGGDSWCADGYAFDTELMVRPAEVGDQVRDFQLQNCLSEEFESIHDIAAEQKALWIIATSGWCPACRQYIPEALNAGAQIPESDLKTILIVGEDAGYGQPTTEYCRQYASHYGEDGSRFYIDHAGGDQGSFRTTFSFIWPYLGENGEFGLPWNAAIGGGRNDYRYEYGDGYQGNRGGVTDAINALLR